MNIIPEYPTFQALSWDMLDELYPLLNEIPDGVSEFTFPSLFLHRYKYNYKISVLAAQNTDTNLRRTCYILTGEYSGKAFFSLPLGLPKKTILADLFKHYGTWKNMNQSQYERYALLLEEQGYEIREDRNNFDYVYDRTALATLAGKQLYKKRTHVNAFLALYKTETQQLNSFNKNDALLILEEWKSTHQGESDYTITKEALQCLESINMDGVITYADGKPAGFAIGELIASGTTLAVHFEKAIESYKGIYQYINKIYAERMPSYVTYINREQDLGDEGLRQAKTTYRPTTFIRKYYVTAGNAHT